MHVLLILGIAIAMGAGLWNMRAAMRAGRGADWRTNRDGLRAPGSSQSFTLLSMVGPTVIIALAAFGVLSIDSHFRVLRASLPGTRNGVKYRFRLGT